MKQDLPKFAEIADMRCQEANPGTKTINIKVAINTARMMVEAELKREKAYRLLVTELRSLAGAYERLQARMDEKAGYTSQFRPAPVQQVRNLLEQIGESA